MKEFEFIAIKETNKALARFASEYLESDHDNSKFCEGFEVEEKRLRDALKDIFNHLDLNEFSCEALESLGFMRWQCSIMLIPRYLVSIIPDGTEVIDIFGESHIIGDYEFSTDIRFGCVAFGVRNNEIKELMKTTGPECNGGMKN